MPRLPLPPLPSVRKWPTYFPRRLLPISPELGVRINPDRVLLSSQKLADQFVQSLDLSENEVVLETYAGVGAVTRSLIYGGNPSAHAESSNAWLESRAGLPADSQPSKVKRGAKQSEIPMPTVEEYPQWPIETPADPIEPIASASFVRPRLVIANEPSPELLVRGMGLDPKCIPSSVHEDVKSMDSFSEKIARLAGSALTPTETLPETDTQDPEDNLLGTKSVDPGKLPLPVERSHHEPNLLLSPTSPYIWPTLPRLLSHPLVTPYMEVYNSNLTGVEATKRPWSAPAPPITVVSQIPTGELGEQLVSQWISSAVGGRSWIWEWGRVRLALLVGKGVYDRITAQPGEVAYCRLTVLTRAVFDIKPLVPYHTPIPKVTKFIPRKESPKVFSSNPDTETLPHDFYPVPYGKAGSPLVPLPRPALQGIQLIPKVNSPIIPSQKESWDFVLRKFFVRNNQSISEGLRSLAFGGENLVDKVEGKELNYNGEPFNGVDVDRSAKVRELEVPEWERIVDVFDKWAFRPEHLILDSKVLDEPSREIGAD